MSGAAQPSTRDRILEAAMRLFQARGYHAVGVNEILERAAAPKGALYHHFPEGKGAIACEAIVALAAAVDGMIDDGFARGKSPGAVLIKVAQGMGRWLEGSRWREGCLIAAMAQENVPDDPAIHDAVRAAYARWRGALQSALLARGRAPAQAEALANLAVACLEGGLILARVDQSAKPLLQAAHQAAAVLDGGA